MFISLRSNMYVKVHLLHSHIDNLAANLGKNREEQDERFHQAIPLTMK